MFRGSFALICGTVELRSNVNLHLLAGATILGSTDMADYVDHPGPPKGQDANPFHLIFAQNCENIALTGRGKIDGSGAAFWERNGRAPVAPEDEWKDVIAHNWSKLERPSPMIELVGCRNLLIEGLRICNSPGWTLRPVNCDDVVIRGIKIKNPIHGCNTDGIDLCGSQNVLISDCIVETGDDAICLKSENHYGDEVRPIRNVTITNCTLTCCCNGIKFGTISVGPVENVTISNVVIHSPHDAPLHSRLVSGIALEMVDGGSIDGVVISNVRMQNVRTPIYIRLANRGKDSKGGVGSLQNVMMSNISASGATNTSSITGIPGYDVSGVTLSDIRIESELAGDPAWLDLEVPEDIDGYPECFNLGHLPACGLYARHVEGLRIRNLEVIVPAEEARPALAFDDVKNSLVQDLYTPQESMSSQFIAERDRCLHPNHKVQTAVGMHFMMSKADLINRHCVGNFRKIPGIVFENEDSSYKGPLPAHHDQ